ncbi:endonuclease domain-containing protein [Microbacterium sp. P05]|uniref:endonuclease domain-containing protein n=1 Tax=Microbacterium sp. P05 TaxID=3366948 RepID=UPI0037450F81
MDLLPWIMTRGGVVRSAALAASGFRQREIQRAVDAGWLLRPRGGWVAAHNADPVRVAAARAGVLLTCVTGAQQLGLWAVADEVAHVAAPPHSGSVKVVNARVHWCRPLVPRPPGALVDPIENVLTTLAACRPFEAALATWESAERQGLIDRATLARLPISAIAQEVLDAMASFSDSGLESFVVPRLTWLRLPIFPQTWIAGHRVDFLIGDRLVLQIDGAHHTGRQREQDIAHDAQLMLLGYHVVRVGYGQVVDRWHEVQDMIMRAVAQGLHLAASHPRPVRA